MEEMKQFYLKISYVFLQLDYYQQIRVSCQSGLH